MARKNNDGKKMKQGAEETIAEETVIDDYNQDNACDDDGAKADSIYDIDNNNDNDNDNVNDAAAAKDEVACLKEENERIIKENKELKDKLLRLAAEYDNYRKRSIKEKESTSVNAVADTIGALLPVYDNLLRASEAAAEKDKTIFEGIAMVIRQFDEILSNMGINPIEAVGKQFNPEIHNAVMHVEDDSVGDNTIIEEFQRGYIMGDKVVRFSMVKVAN